MKRMMAVCCLAAGLTANGQTIEVVGVQDALSRDLSPLFYSDTLPEKPADAALDASPKSNEQQKIASASNAGATSATSVKPATSAHASTDNPPPTPPAPKPVRRVGLKYQILSKTRDGGVRVVPPASEFHTGDKIQIRIESNVDGYLYIFQKGSSGRDSVLFPSLKSDQRMPQVKRGTPYTTPVFNFDNHPGEERLLVIVSKSELDWAAQGDGAGSEEPLKRFPSALVSFSQAEGFVHSAVSSRDLVLFDEAAPNAEADETVANARIAVNKSDQKNDLVYVEIVLKHQSAPEK